MDKQDLIIFKFNTLYEIIKELEENLNFRIFEASNEKTLNDTINSSQNYLIITQKKINDKDNQFVLNQFPIKVSKLIEKLNIQVLKVKFNEKSELSVVNYKLDLNSRELIINDKT